MNWWPFKSKPAQPRPLALHGWQPLANPIPQPDPETKTYRGSPGPAPRPPSGEAALVWPTIDSGLIPLKED